MTFKIIDTPGLSDTRGVDQDDKNLDKILDIAAQLETIEGVILLVNGTSPRLNPSLNNTLTKFKNTIPDVVLDNMIIVLTNSAKHSANFDLDSLNVFKTDHHFFMNNSAFSTDPKKWDKEAREHLQIDWNQSMRKVEEIFSTIHSFGGTSTQAFKDMKNLRHTIKERLHKAELDIKHLQKVQEEIELAEKALGQYANDAEKVLFSFAYFKSH